MTYQQSATELLGIVLFRFRPVPRIWALLLIAVNLASVFFLNTFYGQFAFIAIVLGSMAMLVIHRRLGFVRLLGIGHVLWIPMLIWFARDFPDLQPDSLLRHWVALILVFNSLSLVVDSIDLARYLRGEKAPYYNWD